MDRVSAGVAPERGSLVRIEWRRRRAAGRVRLAASHGETLQDHASAIRRSVAALQGSGLGLDARVLEGLTACADEVDTAAAAVIASGQRSAA